MKTVKKCISLIITALLAVSLFSGCDAFDSIMKSIKGEDETQPLTKSFTYTEPAEGTSVYYIRTAKTDDGLKYKLYSSYVEIVGYSGATTDVVIPDEIDETPVTVIGENAFADSYITSIKISDNVTVIETSAFFDCKTLLEADFGKNVEAIGRYAFFGCKNLITLNFGENLKRIEEYAFNSCSSLESVVFNDGLEFIGDHAFYLCKALFKVYIPETVKSFGSDVFKSANNNFKIYAPADSAANVYAADNSYLYVECYSYLEESFNTDLNDAYIDYDEEFPEDETQEENQGDEINP